MFLFGLSLFALVSDFPLFDLFNFLVHQEIEQVKQREIRDQRKEAEAKEEHERLRREPI